jgi:hypothetical protein
MEIRTNTLRNKRVFIIPPKVVDEVVRRNEKSFHKGKPFLVL